MSIRNERKAHEALHYLSSNFRELSPDKEAFDAAIAALDTVISEYNGFDTSLVLIHRLSNHLLDEEDILREEGKAVGLRLAKSLAALWDINYASRQENAIRGPMRPKIAALEPDDPTSNS